jgi:hypothetical protein
MSPRVHFFLPLFAGKIKRAREGAGMLQGYGAATVQQRIPLPSFQRRTSHKLSDANDMFQSLIGRLPTTIDVEARERSLFCCM